eukprot:5629382-Heterocapsa_arctica.AAC.1
MQRPRGMIGRLRRLRLLGQCPHGHRRRGRRWPTPVPSRAPGIGGSIGRPENGADSFSLTVVERTSAGNVSANVKTSAGAKSAPRLSFSMWSLRRLTPMIVPTLAMLQIQNMVVGLAVAVIGQAVVAQHIPERLTRPCRDAPLPRPVAHVRGRLVVHGPPIQLRDLPVLGRGRADVEPAAELQHELHEGLYIKPLLVSTEADPLVLALFGVIKAGVKVVHNDARHVSREEVVPVRVRRLVSPIRLDVCPEHNGKIRCCPSASAVHRSVTPRLLELLAGDQLLAQARPLCILARITVRECTRVAHEAAAATSGINRRVNAHGKRDVAVDDLPIPFLP